ncbi:MAG: hypothetical protein VX029_05905 [Pseudomonadota bacterium]|nr:hypothetical protein [Pseudomonadota bacterium]
MTPTILRFAIVVLLSASVSLQAQALDSQSKIDLQSALLNFLELTSDGDGLFRVIDRDSGEPLAIHAPKLLRRLFLQKLDPIDQRDRLVSRDIIAGDDVHAAVILRDHDDPERRLLPFVGPRLRAFHAISDDVLHQFDKDREDVPDLRSVAGMILQALTQGVADGEEYVLRHIARVAKNEFVPQQQLAKLEKPVKLRNTANVPQARTTTSASRLYSI